MQLLSINRVTAEFVGSVLVVSDSILVIIFYCDMKPSCRHISFGFIMCESFITAKRNSGTLFTIYRDEYSTEFRINIFIEAI